MPPGARVRCADAAEDQRSRPVAVVVRPHEDANVPEALHEVGRRAHPRLRKVWVVELLVQSLRIFDRFPYTDPRPGSMASLRRVIDELLPVSNLFS